MTSFRNYLSKGVLWSGRPHVSPLPCSLISSYCPYESNDTPIKMIMTSSPKNSSKAKYLGSTRSRQKSNKMTIKYLMCASHNDSISYSRLKEENLRLHSYLEKCKSLLHYQTMQNYYQQRRLRLRDLEEELNRLEVGSMSPPTKNLKYINNLKIVKQYLTCKVERLYVYLKQTREEIKDLNKRLQKKKDTLKERDYQLRRYVVLLEELRHSKHVKEPSSSDFSSICKPATSRPSTKALSKNTLSMTPLNRVSSGSTVKTTRGRLAK